MNPDSSTAPERPELPRDAFVKTRWTVVLTVGRKLSPDSDQALDPAAAEEEPQSPRATLSG
jgi:hypothetical protein